jgi:tRNA (guanine37-N1)-methyltransferase
MKAKRLTFHVITLFPELIEGYLSHSIIKRGIEGKAFAAHAINPRDFTADKHHKADDRPYGGGPGMVLKAEPILRAIASLRLKNRKIKHLIMSPRGKEFTNAYARRLAKSYDDIVLIAGHYEGIDARVKKALRAEEISVGSYTVTGGEMPALMIIDATARQIPGVLGRFESLEDERISSGEMYTRPEAFTWKKKPYRVPAVLRSGHHAAIDAWRTKKERGEKKAPNLKKR